MKARDIRRRTITLFVLGIAVPSSLLAYLAFRGIRNDQALLERERREDLRAALDDVVAAHDSMLTALGRELDTILAAPAPDSVLDRAILAFVARNATVDAAFRLSTDGRIHRLITAGLLYTSTPDFSEVKDRGADSPALERVRRREFAGADPASVLAMYRNIVTSASRADVRADALNASARLERKLGNFGTAMSDYRRLAEEFGSERTAGGVPFRLVARLELATTEREAGDAPAAAHTLLDVYGELLHAAVKLARGQYTFLEQQVRERTESAITDLTAPSERQMLSDSFDVLSSMEERARKRTERLLLFVRSAGSPLSSRALRRPDRVDPYARLMLDLDGRAHAVQLGSRLPSGETSPETWGVLLDTDELVKRLAFALTDRTAGASVGWSLADPTGTRLRGVGTEEVGVATVSSGLPDGVPPLTISLYPADAGFVSTLLTSHRGIFFYAFVLLAGILVVGLVLTMNTISQQLELARMQSDFVSTVSHEFRSPLTAIRQIGEMLQADRVPSEARRRRYYDVLVEQSERLSLLVNRVLDFARMEDGQHAFTMQAVDVNAFLDDLVSDIEQRVDHEGFVIHREVEPDLPRMNADLDALKQAVSNLIDNAIKYSGDSRELIVRGFAENGHVIVAVQDFGKGMDAAERSRVFERFYRGGDSLTRSVKGTGLGLTMVKHIVEGHGGHIDVESTPGNGSTFTIRLPVERQTHG